MAGMSESTAKKIEQKARAKALKLARQHKLKCTTSGKTQCIWVDPITKRRCKSMFAHPEKRGRMCRVHAIKEGIINDDRDIVAKKQRDTWRVKRKQIQDKLEREMLSADDIYHKIVGDMYFDLEDYVKEVKSIGENLTEKIAKQLFVRWWFADIETRSPKTQELCAMVLGYTKIKIVLWIESDDFNKMIENYKKKVDVMLSPFVQKAMLIKCLSGDKDAMKEYYGQIDDSLKGGGGLDLGTISKELLDEAEELSGVVDNKSGSVFIEDVDLADSIREEM